MATTIFLVNPVNFGGGGGFANDYSLLFDGVDEYVDCGQPTVFDGVTNWSVSCWFKFTSNGVYAPWGYRGGSSGRIRAFWQHTISSMQVEINTGTNAYHRTSTSITSGNWYHMVVVYDGTLGTASDRCKVYINGSLDTPATTSGTFPSVMNTLSGGATDRDFNLGKYNATTYEMVGNVDETAIFNYSLNATQVSDLYNSGAPTDLDNTSGVTAPVHWWRMGDGDTFPTITDVGTTGGFDGTMTNMEAGDIVTDTP